METITKRSNGEKFQGLSSMVVLVNVDLEDLEDLVVHWLNLRVDSFSFKFFL
jgi:hypothetical protein